MQRNDPVDFDQAMDNFVRSLNNVISDFDIDTSTFLNSLVMDIHPLTVEYLIPNDFVPIEVQEQVQNQVESLTSWILGMFNNLLEYPVVNSIWNEMLTIDYNDALNIVLFSLGVSVVFYTSYMVYTGVYYVYRMVTYPFFVLDELLTNSSNSILQLINWINQSTNNYSNSSYLDRFHLLLDRLLGPVDDPDDNIEIESSPQPRFLPERDMESRFLNHIRDYYERNNPNLIDFDEGNRVSRQVLTYVNRDNINNSNYDNNTNDTSRNSINSDSTQTNLTNLNSTQTNLESFNDSVTSLDRQSEVDLIMLYDKDYNTNNLEHNNPESINTNPESINTNLEGFIRSRQNSNGTIMTNPDGIITNDNIDIQTHLNSRSHISTEQTLFNRVEIETFHPSALDMFDITRFDLSSRLKEYILTLRNYQFSSDLSISQQIQLYTDHINSKPMPELIMHKIMSCYFNFTVNDWMEREIHHGVDFFDHSEYVIEFVDNLALILANT